MPDAELSPQSDPAPPIRVLVDGSRWIVDYGGGITRRFASRDDAVATAREAAAADQRDLDLAV